MIHWVIIAGEVIVASILIILSLRNGQKIDSQVSAENKSLKLVNDRLQARVQRLEITDRQHDDDIELLQKQMLQVHEWVSQVTFSDFIDKVDTLRARVKETKEQRESRLDRTTQEYYDS